MSHSSRRRTPTQILKSGWAEHTASSWLFNKNTKLKARQLKCTRSNPNIQDINKIKRGILIRVNLDKTSNHLIILLLCHLGLLSYHRVPRCLCDCTAHEMFADKIKFPGGHQHIFTIYVNANISRPQKNKKNLIQYEHLWSGVNYTTKLTTYLNK